jgi:outer membrane protein insertion porin family
MQLRIKQYRFSAAISILPTHAITLLFCIVLMSGCTATKFLKEDESFYTGAKIKIQAERKVAGQKRLLTKLEQYLLPKPNKTVLGSRPGVWFYYVAGTPTKKKGIRNFIKTKLGNPPVLLSHAQPKKMAATLQTEVNNNGYFRSTVWYEIKTKRKKSLIIYTVNLQRPYRLRNIDYDFLDTTYLNFSQAVINGSLLKENRRYQLERLQKDQERIEEVAKNNGYYYFDDRYLLFDADSSVGKRRVDVTLNFERKTPPKMSRIYRVRNITVFPNYELSNDSVAAMADTTMVDGFRYIDNRGQFRPRIITNVINVIPDSVYRRINHEYTLSRLMSLKTFKFVNMKFTESKEDSSSLDATIYLTPLLKKSVRFQVEGVSKSNNFVGPGLELMLTNRNIFRGAEMLQLKLNTAYETQISRQQSGALNSIELGASLGLYIPRFIAPIRIRSRSTKYLPQTEFKLANNFQQRIRYFRLTSFSASYGYTWRETTFRTHQLFPVDITFVKSSKTSEEFDALLEQNPTLANSFQNQFIIGSHYSFIINTQLREDIVTKYEARDDRKSHFYFNGTVDLSGNIISTLQGLNKSNEPPHEVLGSPYSQYVILSSDFRYYYQLNRKSKLAARLFAGAGYAYGNSANLPYIKQFASGGSNSVRAFPARSIGPGTYNIRTDTTVTSDTYFIDQRGDIKLEANVEYRFDIFKALKGAVFADAGNIWLWNKDPLRPGAEFKKDKFLSELAIGTGVGIRYDFNFFVLRLDVAFPIRKPYLEENNRWVFDEITFGSSAWRKQNIVFNIAIGYPF